MGQYGINRCMAKTDSRTYVKINNKNARSLRAYKVRTNNPATLPALVNCALELGILQLPETKYGK